MSAFTVSPAMLDRLTEQERHALLLSAVEAVNDYHRTANEQILTDWAGSFDVTMQLRQKPGYREASRAAPTRSNGQGRRVEDVFADERASRVLFPEYTGDPRMSAVATWIGFAVLAMLALAVLFLVLAPLVVQVIKTATGNRDLSTAGRMYRDIDNALLRRWHVHRPGDDTYGTRKCWTFRGARRVALRTRGTRLWQPGRLVHAVVRPGWSEHSNGYVERCAFCQYPDEVPFGRCYECGRDEERLLSETGFVPEHVLDEARKPLTERLP